MSELRNWLSRASVITTPCDTLTTVSWETKHQKYLPKPFPTPSPQKLWDHKGLSCQAAAAAAKSLQSCPTLCDSIDGSPPGSPVPGILQATILEWVAISSSNAWKWKVKVKSLSRVGLVVTPWTAAHQAPPSMGFSRQEYWSGVPSSLILLQMVDHFPQQHLLKKLSFIHCVFFHHLSKIKCP